ncbi:MAG: AsmA family protein [Burkholderiales bacterium]
MPLLGSDSGGSTDAPLVPLKVNGSVGKAQIDFEGQALALLGAPRIDGRIKLRAGSLGRVGDALGLTLPETAPFQLQANLRHGTGVWRVRDVQLSVGHSHIGGDYRYDTRVDPPLLSGQLNASQIRLADLGPLVGVQAEGKKHPDGKVLPEREFDIPSLAAMDADVQVNIDELDFGTPSLRPVFDLRTHLVLSGSVLRLENLQAHAGGGSLSGMSQLDGRKGAAVWHAELRFNGLDVAKWIAGVRKSGSDADGTKQPSIEPVNVSSPATTALRPVAAYLTGELDAYMKVRGAGASTASILASLDGDAQATIRHGTVSHLVTEILGIDVAQALGVAVRGDDALPLRCARLDLNIDKGILVPRVAIFDNRDSTVRLTGNLNLRDEAIALRATTSPKDFSLVALRAPVIVSGTLGAPHVEIDAAPVVARAAASIALGVLATPVAALLPLIDPGSKEEGDPCAMSAPHASQAAADHGARVSAAQGGKSSSSP